MKLPAYPNTPFEIKLNFEPLIRKIEEVAADPQNERAANMRSLLQELEAVPEFRTGITDLAQIEQNEGLIRRLFADLFPEALTNNEIKGISIPYMNLIFNHSARFKKILEAAGRDFEIIIRDFDEHRFYVMNCCLILNEFYGTDLNFSKPLFYDIPTATGVTKHYRILYNADFLEIKPTEKSVMLTQDDIDLLLNNYDDLELWKEKFPQESWLSSGFTIMSLVDATVENAVSTIKEKLIGINAAGFEKSASSLYSSIFQEPDIRIGFTLYNQEDASLSVATFGTQMRSYLLATCNTKEANITLSRNAYQKLVEQKTYFAVSDTREFEEKNPDITVDLQLACQGIHSFILAPVVKNDVLLGILEVVSSKPMVLNSINAHKLDVVMPFFTDNIERLITQWQNQVQAFIQDKYTTIHPSVSWKFRAEAQKHLLSIQAGKPFVLRDMSFPDVYPLYGQIDIKGSSDARNHSLQLDLQEQLKAIMDVLKAAYSTAQGQALAKHEEQLKRFLSELDEHPKIGTEETIELYLQNKVYPLLRKITDAELLSLVQAYFLQTDKHEGGFYANRRKYNYTISLINSKLASLLDKQQVAAQYIFPHYYERFKTDGVDHNLYIGESISPHAGFELSKLHALRFWQLQALCQMEQEHYHSIPSLPYLLEVTSLILVYSSPINICFRMDEKRFDVDGSYSVRYEIVKKRIDKAHVKGTDERITQAGKITIVYSNEADEQEYRGYIARLQAQNVLGNAVECFDVEDLQGVAGLKALRVRVLHDR